MVRGDKYREGQSHDLHVNLPADSNTTILEKSEELKKVEVVDDKVLAAKRRKENRS